ncbi:thioredoxin domain-containing protein [Streptomyces sp. NPDC048636]|uniref:thioredoxin domain-containing protein n=1 Tax=Streptomyces sp. NPDC048636 TaxID=3155762 RepID=UPI0034435217
MWPGQHGQQPPGGEPDPQHNGQHQPFPPPGTTPPGSPPPPPGPPPAQPPGFPPGPPPPPGGGGGGGWGPPPPPRDRQRRAALTTIIGVSAAAAVLAAILVITDDDATDPGSQGSADQSQPSLPGPAGSAPSGSTDDSSGSGAAGASNSGGGGGNSNGGADGSGSGALVKPAHTSGPHGTTVLIGTKGSGHTLDVYEDLRCPPCARFEQKVGPTVRKDIKNGTYQASFHFATFLDKSLKGSGSKNALSALGAALNVSTDAFLDYKAALLSEEHHPEEAEDSFAGDAFLLDIADDVPALENSAAFREAVRKGTYDRWAQEMASAFDRSGVGAAPTVKLDGTALTGSGGSAPLTATEFTEAVNDQLKG